jgi:hypothetical protein
MRGEILVLSAMANGKMSFIRIIIRGMVEKRMKWRPQLLNFRNIPTQYCQKYGTVTPFGVLKFPKRNQVVRKWGFSSDLLG